ncbi:intermembrane transport protein PqiB [Qingshengfaniella alkalisoli]|uniref:MCE family protein n=1 Tax=Qingshengfaniella alkalisoli TaxID=2599296 RepID=A0A5B8J6P3_9RHOB|nr:MlaD family protein [Qingshengfaniella alkalisoli]QDY70107.1 MCE family protein [Qingshengfaniella alkalisoli]
MTDPTPGKLDIETAGKKRRSLPAGLSPVWLVPITALVIALIIAFQQVSQRGHLIEISFENADGIVAGQTQIQFRNVPVGTVEQRRFSEDLAEVIVTARISSELEDYVDNSAEFWIVRPEVTPRGVSGLETVISGAYIQANWDAEKGEAKTSFVGLETPPVNTTGRDGLEIQLIAREGGRLSSGAPLIFKGVEVGQIGQPELSPDGSTIVASAFINAPYDGLVTTSTKFWKASGFQLNVGSSGISLEVASLASLVEGGLEFGTLVSGGTAAKSGQAFEVFESEGIARESVFAPGSSNHVMIGIMFDGTISGLTVDAPVEYQGLRVGTVTNLAAVVEGEGEDRSVDLRADVSINPSQLGMDEQTSAEDVLAFLQQEVENGLRARLTNQNLLSSSLKIELTQAEDPVPAEMDLDAEPYPLLPSSDADISDVSASAQSVLDRVAALPIEELMRAGTNLLVNANTLISSEEVRDVPRNVSALLEDARGIVGSEEAQNLIPELHSTINELQKIVTRIGQGTAVNNLLAALERVDSISESIDATAAQFPDLVEKIDALATKANTLPLEQLVQSADDVLASANDLISSEETAQIPASLSAALDELSASLEELRAGGAVENVNETLASARVAAEAVEEAAASLPALSARLQSLVAQSETVIAAYGSRSEFNAQTLATMRDLREAARAVTSLSRAIERNPNSLILGR